MTLFELAAKLTMDKGDFERGAQSAAKDGESLADKLEGSLSKIGDSIKKYLGLAAIAKVGSDLASMGMQYNSKMEDFVTNFKVMLGGNIDAAEAKVAELSKFAASTPFSMDTLAQGTQTLLAFGIQSERSTDILRMLGDVSLGDAGKMQTMANAFGKASASGKLTGEVVQSLIGAGFNPLLLISEKTGESMEELQKRMSAGKVSVEELEDAFKTATSEGGQFYKGMEEASKTVSGMTSTLADNWTSFWGSMTKPFYDVYKDAILPTLLEGVGGLLKWAEKAKPAFDAFGKSLTTAFKNGVANVKNIGSAFTKATARIQSSFNMAKAIFKVNGNDSLPSIIKGLASSVGKSALEIGDSIAAAIIPDWEGVKANIASNIQPVVDTVTEYAANIWRIISGKKDKYTSDDFKNDLAGAWEKIKDGAANAVSIAIQAGQTIWAALNGDEAAQQEIKTTLINAWDKIKEGASSAVSAVKTNAELIWAALNGDAEAQDTIKNGLQTAWEKVTGAVQTAYEKVTGVASYIWAALTGNDIDTEWELEQVWIRISSAATNAYNTATQVLNDITTALIGENGKEAIIDFVTTQFGLMKGAASDLWTNVQNIIADILKLFKGEEDAEAIGTDIISQIIQGALTYVNYLLETVGNVIGSVLDIFFGEGESSEKPEGKTVIETAIDNIISAAGKMLTAIVNAFRDAWAKFAESHPDSPIVAAANTITAAVNAISDACETAINWLHELFATNGASAESLAGYNETQNGYTYDPSMGGYVDGSGNFIPSFAKGLDYVPYDGFRASLHKGEEILTAQEANAYRSASSGLTKGDLEDAFRGAVSSLLGELSITMDGETVGKLIAPAVDRTIAQSANTLRYSY